jgi:hypothetical protein
MGAAELEFKQNKKDLEKKLVELKNPFFII